MKRVILYTDGGCRGNHKRSNIGGIGGILIHPASNTEKEYKAGYKDTTNNRMELLAVITGLEYLKEPCEVEIYSDSAYLVNAMTLGWFENWKKNGWKRGKEPLKNVDLWKKLDELNSIHKLEFKKVKGHANNRYNNRADELVNQAMDEI